MLLPLQRCSDVQAILSGLGMSPKQVLCCTGMDVKGVQACHVYSGMVALPPSPIQFAALSCHGTPNFLLPADSAGGQCDAAIC